MDDDSRVTCELYRLKPPRRQRAAGNGDLGEALDAVGASGSVREALDAAKGIAPASADAAEAFWPDTPVPHFRQWAAYAGRALRRVDVWILIVGIVGVVIAYLAWVKPH